MEKKIFWKQFCFENGEVAYQFPYEGIDLDDVKNQTRNIVTGFEINGAGYDFIRWVDKNDKELEIIRK